MRELAKSFVRLSWAMSVFGLEQTRELFRDDDDEESGVGRDRPATRAARVAERDTEPSSPPSASTTAGDDADTGKGRRATRRVASSLDDLAADLHHRLGRRASSIYESGNDLQGEVFDLVFDTFDSDEWRPGRILDRAAEVADKSAERLRDWASDEKERDRGSKKRSGRDGERGGDDAEAPDTSTS